MKRAAWSEEKGGKRNAMVHETQRFNGHWCLHRGGRSGGAKCALQDYGNMLQMHLAGGMFQGRRVLSEASVLEMRKDQLNGIEFTPVPSHAAHGYGLSWWFDLVAEKGAPVQISVPGVYGAIPWINLDLGYGGFQLVGKRLPPSAKLYREIYPISNRKLA